jgi:hypothetical protein
MESSADHPSWHKPWKRSTHKHKKMLGDSLLELPPNIKTAA